MQTNSWLMSFGSNTHIEPVTRSFKRGNQPRYDRTELVRNIIKIKEDYKDQATHEFVYYELIDDGLMPMIDGVPAIKPSTFRNYCKQANKLIAGYKPEEKNCAECGKKFKRKVAICSKPRWEKLMFCSTSCASKVTQRNRWARVLLQKGSV